MSVIIHNIGGDPNGVSEYELCINERRLATFKHDRRKGLAECLREAAKAMDRTECQKLRDFIDSQQSIPINIARILSDYLSQN